MEAKVIKPKEDVYIALDKRTGKRVFIERGARYDQSSYSLMFSVTADQVVKCLVKEATHGWLGLG